MSKKARDRIEWVVVWLGVPIMVAMSIALLLVALGIQAEVMDQREVAEEAREVQLHETREVLGRTDTLLDRVTFLVAFVEDVQESEVTHNGIVCLLGSIAGREEIQRPEPETTRQACSLFFEEANGGNRE